MKHSIKYINDRGIQEIYNFLSERSKMEKDHFTHSMLQAWANDAEFQLSEGNPPSIELKSWETVSGKTEEMTISSAGVSLRGFA